MQICRVGTESVQIEARYMSLRIAHYSQPSAEIRQTFRSIFCRLASGLVVPGESCYLGLSAYTAVSMFLQVATAAVHTSGFPSLPKELQPGPRKMPPKITKLAILSKLKPWGHLFRVLILLISTISYTKSKDLPYSRPDDRFATEHILP